MSPLNLQGVNLPSDVQLLPLSCTGSECGQYAMPLSQLLGSRGLSRAQFDKVAVVVFSAGGQFLSPLLGYDDDGDNRVDGAVSLDGCFTIQASAPDKPGFQSYGAKAASGSRILVMTASAGQNGPGLPPSRTGAECALYNAQVGAAAVGKTLSPTDLPPELADAPMVAVRAGNLVVVDAGAAYPSVLHGDMVLRYGPATMNAYLVPILDGSWSSGPSWVTLVAAAVGFGIGVAAVRSLTA